MLEDTAAFSRAFFQVAKRMTAGNPVKTVACLTRLTLSESANFNGILIKFKLQNRSAINFGQSRFACGQQLKNREMKQKFHAPQKNLSHIQRHDKVR